MTKLGCNSENLQVRTCLDYLFKNEIVQFLVGLSFLKCMFEPTLLIPKYAQLWALLNIVNIFILRLKHWRLQIMQHENTFFLKIWLILCIWEAATKLSSQIHYDNDLSIQVWARLAAVARDSIQVFHVGDRVPTTWTTTRRHPGFSLTCKRSQSWDAYLVWYVTWIARQCLTPVGKLPAQLSLR